MEGAILAFCSWLLLAFNLIYAVWLDESDKFEISDGSGRHCEYVRLEFKKSIIIGAISLAASAIVQSLVCLCIGRKYRPRIISVILLATIIGFYSAFIWDVVIGELCVFVCIGSSQCISNATQINVSFLHFLLCSITLYIFQIWHAFFPKSFSS